MKKCSVPESEKDFFMNKTVIDLSTIDVTSPANSFDRNFKRCIGTGRIDLALRQDYMDNLHIVQTEIGFDMIRGHGLFSDPMGLYREQMDMSKVAVPFSRPLHSFTRLFQVFDNFLSAGIEPFVELGFMPSDLASGDQVQFWWKGNVTPPKDEAKWSALVRDMVLALIRQYGLEQVCRWPFEIWNEPDLPQFWKDRDEAAYHRLYALTARAIKGVHKDLQVGGPATSPGGGEWTPRFLDMCHKENLPVDFIAHHVYVGTPAENSEEFVYMGIRGTDKCLQRFKQVPDFVAGSAYPHLPVHITEWNTSYSPRCPVHDTAFNAAYLAWVITHVGEYVDSLSYWTFCDVFEEQDIPKSIFHGGFGLLTETGLRKPSFHAFAFADRLSGPVIHRDDISCITRREDGSYAGLFFKVDPRCSEGKGSCQDVHLRLPFNSEALLSLRYVDDVRGNAYTTWKTLGRPRWPLDWQREILEHAQWPLQEQRILQPDAGILDVNFQLPTNGIVLLEIFERGDETKGYLGLRKEEYPALPEDEI
jgi:xylan 1,4-beta-xylosidase